mmetsp:Transcript_166633/g.404966  ORF Transcript_166633/g.404966 Transcript_166633/m.404966 type:complete len:107 (+) Transcript_166633:596-916(+)
MKVAGCGIGRTDLSGAKGAGGPGTIPCMGCTGEPTPIPSGIIGRFLWKKDGRGRKRFGCWDPGRPPCSNGAFSAMWLPLRGSTSLVADRDSSAQVSTSGASLPPGS